MTIPTFILKDVANHSVSGAANDVPSDISMSSDITLAYGNKGGPGYALYTEIGMHTCHTDFIVDGIVRYRKYHPDENHARAFFNVAQRDCQKQNLKLGIVIQDQAPG